MNYITIICLCIQLVITEFVLFLIIFIRCLCIQLVITYLALFLIIFIRTTAVWRIFLGCLINIHTHLFITTFFLRVYGTILLRIIIPFRFFLISIVFLYFLFTFIYFLSIDPLQCDTYFLIIIIVNFFWIVVIMCLFYLVIWFIWINI